MQNALVTGASSGLGRAIALRLARAGYRVFATVRAADDAPPDTVPVVLDLGDPERIAETGREVDRACGGAGLSVLVNAAAFATYTPVEYAADADVERLFAVVAFAPYRLTNALLPALRRATGARVVNITSWAAFDASPFVGFYAAAKAACLRLGQAQAFELERSGVAVVSVVPGSIRTRFVERAASEITEAVARLPAEGRAAYAGPMEHMARMSLAMPNNRLVPHADAVAAKVVAIARKRRPRHEYLVGLDTRLVIFLSRWLPFRLFRALKRSLYGLRTPRPVASALL